MKNSRSMTGWAVAALMFAPGLWAQNVPQSMGLRPLEHVIEDREPLRLSLKRLDNGLGAMGQESRIYRGDPNGTTGGLGKVNLVSPGVWAEFDQSQYREVQKGKFKGVKIQTIPANTVFHLAPPQQVSGPAAPRSLRSGQIRTDIDGGLDTRETAVVRASVAGRSQAGGDFEDQNVGPVDPELQNWREYDRILASSRRSLLMALEELRTAGAPLNPSGFAVGQ